MVKKELDQITAKLESIRIQQADLLAQEKKLLQRQTKLTGRQGSFSIGDRVVITNSVSHVAPGQRITIKDRTGRVTKLQTHKDERLWVYVLTDNGSNVHRLPKNLRHQQ